MDGDQKDTAAATGGEVSLQSFILQAIEDKRVFVRRGIVYFSSGRKMACLSVRGYVVGTLHNRGMRKQVKAHQVVWLWHRGAIREGHVLDHRNRIPTDNRLCNLREVTPRENTHNRRPYVGVNNPAAKITPAIAAQIRAAHARNFGYQKVAQRFNISATSVANIIRGKSWL